MLPALDIAAGAEAAAYAARSQSGGGDAATNGREERFNQRLEGTVYDEQLETRALVPDSIVFRIVLGALWRRAHARVTGKPLKVVHPKFDGRSETMAELNRHIREWWALHAIYHRVIVPNELDEEYAKWWYGMTQGAAVRNRFRITLKALKESILRYADQEEIRIASIACGSALAVLLAVRWGREQGLNVTATLVDVEAEPLRYARQFAEQAGISEFVRCHQRDATRPLLLDGLFHIIEVVGFLDYRPDPQALKLMQTVYNLLVDGGTFITACVAWCRDVIFLRVVMDWHMVHRTKASLVRIVRDSQFVIEQAITEPMGAHNVIVAHK